jgi:hypothetical protein
MTRSWFADLGPQAIEQRIRTSVINHQSYFHPNESTSVNDLKWFEDNEEVSSSQVQYHHLIPVDEPNQSVERAIIVVYFGKSLISNDDE